MIRSKINPEAREILLGHSIGLGNSYYRPHPDELLEEYMKAVNLLTINNEFRHKKKVTELEAYKHEIALQQQQQIDRMQAAFQKLQEAVGEKTGLGA